MTANRNSVGNCFITFMRISNTIAVSAMTLVVTIYQQLLSPLFPNKCRFTPRCSEYMIEALRTWGLLKGGWLGIKRILRCHPFGKWGYDPVPRKEEPDS